MEIDAKGGRMLQIVADKPGTDWSDLAREVKDSLRQCLKTAGPSFHKKFYSNPAGTVGLFRISVGAEGLSSVFMRWLNEQCGTLVCLAPIGLAMKVHWELCENSFQKVFVRVRWAPELELD
jgi:hypothetical protein